MVSAQDKIAEIEAEMARMQINKATMKHLGCLKARLSKLKAELLESSKAGTQVGMEGFSIAKQGDSRIGLIGFPSVGKSTLMSNLSGVHSEAAAYEFTTLTAIPGIIYYKGAKIQLIDLPGIIEGAKDGKGRGKQVIAVAKSCSMLLIVLDVMKPMQHKRVIERELEGFGIRLNKIKPDIKIRKIDKGGIQMRSSVKQSELDLDYLRMLLSEHKIGNAEVILDCDATAEQITDVILGNRAYIPAIYVLNKIDSITIKELELIYTLPHCIPVSAEHKWNFDDLLAMIWDYMDLVRIYTKPPGDYPDFSEPVILKKSRRSISDLCNRLHKDLLKGFKYALVWGKSARYVPQNVGKNHILEDEDVVQLVKRR
ncbi:MAG: GTP-binding protein [Marteilia pararefringens]